MSFLNPVNEPVLRFKSTDTGAPQINYNSRVAGDVKAVLKACLVTGYGATASAGWTAVNEASHVIEFVSPSAAMSDYRFCMNDGSTSNTTWSYTYQDVPYGLYLGSPVKTFSYHNKTHALNGWHLLVTERGIIFIEVLYSTLTSGLVCRLTYFGASKRLIDNSSRNICFFTVGMNSSQNYPSAMFTTNAQYLVIDDPTEFYKFFGPIYSVTGDSLSNEQALVAIDSGLYIASMTQGFKGQIPGFFTRSGDQMDFTVSDINQSELNQKCLKVFLGSSASGSLAALKSNSICALIPLESWGY